MNLKLKIAEVIKEIKHAPDSDDVSGIIRRLIDELIDENIMGLELRMFLQYLYNELKKNRTAAENFIEVNNFKHAQKMTEHFGKILGMKIYHYWFNQN